MDDLSAELPRLKIELEKIKSGQLKITGSLVKRALGVRGESDGMQRTYVRCRRQCP